MIIRTSRPVEAEAQTVHGPVEAEPPARPKRCTNRFAQGRVKKMFPLDIIFYLYFCSWWTGHDHGGRTCWQNMRDFSAKSHRLCDLQLWRS